jgi:N-acetylmuramoyl-L-alanine amidase
MPAVLKVQKLIGSLVPLLLFTSCRTPPVSEPETGPPPVPFSSYTNQALQALQPIQTNAGFAISPAKAAPASAPLRDIPLKTVTPAPLHLSLTNHLPPEKWLAWESWTTGSGLGPPQRVRNVPTWTYELRGTNGVLEITAGNRTALWNGLNLELGFVPRVTNGFPLVHTLDVQKTLAVLSLPSPLFGRPERVVVIDPGHGGENFGAKSVLADRFEKEFALDWARRLVPLLEDRGWKVHLTRTNDVEVSLADRVVFADAVHADLFVSLHFNSSDQPQGHVEQGGIETYCLTPVGMPSTLTRRFEDEQNHGYPNNAFDLENYYYATRLQRALVEATHRKDRGVRRARFMGVLRGQNRPAVLVEAGYLTYAPEARLIATAEYRQQLAEAVARALSD